MSNCVRPSPLLRYGMLTWTMGPTIVTCVTLPMVLASLLQHMVLLNIQVMVCVHNTPLIIVKNINGVLQD